MPKPEKSSHSAKRAKLPFLAMRDRLNQAFVKLSDLNIRVIDLTEAIAQANADNQPHAKIKQLEQELTELEKVLRAQEDEWLYYRNRIKWRISAVVMALVIGLALLDQLT